jgi:hypothetical protein
MVEIPLRHHVYSSLRGYRTIYCSPEIPAETRTLLDETARKCQRPASGGLSAFVSLGGGLAGAIRGFPHGVDHVGRPRVCVHTVIVAEEQLARIPLFTPGAFPPELFMNDGMDLQYAANSLRSAWILKEAPLASAMSRLQELPEPSVVRLLLPVLLTEGRTEYVVDGNRSEVARAFDVVSLLLPPTRRRRLGFFRGVTAPEGGLPTSCPLYLLHEAPPEALGDPEVTLIDFARGVHENLPPVTHFAKALLELQEKGKVASLAKISVLAERYAQEVEFNDHMLGQFADAAVHAAKLVGADGSMLPAIDAVAVARAAPGFARAGCARLTAIFLHAAAKMLAPSDQGLLKRIEKLVSAPPDSRLEAEAEDIVRLIDPSRKQDSLSDTNFML